MAFKNRQVKRITFALSLVLCVLWGLLGTGASLAWFKDSTPEMKNVFHFAEFDLQLFYRLDDGIWEEVGEDTELFKREALYEPGYVETVYLKVKNNGNVPFDWKTAVCVYSYVPGVNVFGTRFNLQDYLKFGLVKADTEEEILALCDTRNEAVLIANEPLNNYSSETASLESEGEAFVALVVRMPEEVTNVANYKHPHQPEVYLGVIASANQQK